MAEARATITYLVLVLLVIRKDVHWTAGKLEMARDREALICPRPLVLVALQRSDANAV